MAYLQIIIMEINLPNWNRSKDECAKAWSADGYTRGEGSLLLKVHGHAHNGRQVDQAESET